MPEKAVNAETIIQMRRVKRPQTAADLRNRASLRAVIKLLDGAATDASTLWSIARIMSADEFMQVAEERALANLCGNATCSNHMDLSKTTKLRPDAGYDFFCSPNCKTFVYAFAERLGSTSQALSRFELLMSRVESENSKVKKRDFAAGTATAPIMLAQVVEKQPGEASASTAPTAKRALSVEGYIPKTSKKSVRFSDQTQVKEIPSMVEDLEGQQQQKPVLVFDVEDPSSPLDGNALNTRFGTLRVADSEEDDIPEEAIDVTARLDQILTRQIRAGVQRLAPKLTATLPPELDAALEESDVDEEEEEGEEGDWMKSDDSESDEDGVSSFKMRITFFGLLHTQMEAWVSESTLEYVALKQQAAPPVQTSSEGLEILAQFIGRAVPGVIEQLAIDVPRQELDRYLNDLLRTLQVVGSLPGFTASQWQLVTVVFMKALSLTRVPALRSAFDTRAGIHRISRLLGSLAFTIEEFYAVLELLVRPEEPVQC